MRPLRLAVSAAPVAFGLHVADEAPGFALSLATTALALRGGRHGFLAHYTSLTSQAVFNAIFHVASRAPGGRTAVGVVLPLWLATTAFGRRAGLLDARGRVPQYACVSRQARTTARRGTIPQQPPWKGEARRPASMAVAAMTMCCDRLRRRLI